LLREVASAARVLNIKLFGFAFPEGRFEALFDSREQRLVSFDEIRRQTPQPIFNRAKAVASRSARGN
jgi:hypothetical protein